MTQRPAVALATCARFPDLTPDDHLLRQALAGRDIDTAARIVGRTPEPSLYARVDGCVVGGRFLLMELELIEPVLFLAHAPEAAHRLAEEIASRLGPP